jgi:two-component sensor histidine kinase
VRLGLPGEVYEPPENVLGAMSDIDFERVFEALPSPHMLLDRAFCYVTVNSAYERVVSRLFPNDGESGRRLRGSFELVFASGNTDTLAYIPYDIPRPAAQGGGFEQRYWTAVHVPVFDEAGAVKYLMQNSVDVTEVARLREAASLPFRTMTAETKLLERAKEAETTNRQLLAESADFRRLFQQAPAFVAVLSGPEHVFTFTSDSYVRLVGGRNVLGKPVSEALPEVVEQGFVALLDRVFHEGITHQAEGARVMLDNVPGRRPSETYLDFSYAPIRAVDGAITGVFVQGMDRTESVRAQRRQQLLIDELNHRVKNTLATVQSIASQTLRATSDPQAAREAFEARIVALSKAHNMLSERKWDDTEIGRIIQQELSAYEGTRIRLDGPVLVINAKATIALALVIHELATNAAKHGAIGRSEGRLSVTWREDDEGALVIDWNETGVAPLTAPQSRGFGSRMLERVVAGELGGRLASGFEPDGFSATLVIPAAGYRTALA